MRNEFPKALQGIRHSQLDIDAQGEKAYQRQLENHSCSRIRGQLAFHPNDADALNLLVKFTGTGAQFVREPVLQLNITLELSTHLDTQKKETPVPLNVLCITRTLLAIPVRLSLSFAESRVMR